MSEYQRIEAMRLGLATREDDDDAYLCVAEPPAAALQRHNVATRQLCGVRFQRCGGGVRIIRKRIGGDQ